MKTKYKVHVLDYWIKDLTTRRNLSYKVSFERLYLLIEPYS